MRRLARMIPLLVSLAACHHAGPAPAGGAPAAGAPADDAPDISTYIGRDVRDFRAFLADHADVAIDADLAANGVELVVVQDRVDTIFLTVRSGDGHIYRGPLPLGIQAEMSRAEIEAKLGSPLESGNPEAIGRPGRQPWIKYRRPEAQVHFEFLEDGTLRMVTLMRPDWEPGR